MVVRYSRDALKFLSKQSSKTVQKIRDAIEGLTKMPPQGDIKKLEGFNDGRMRLRVGGFRIVYKFTNENEVEILLIIDIGSRGDVYK